MPFGLDLVDGLLIAIGMAVVLVVGRFLVALARGEEPREAVTLTGRWTTALIAGAGATGAMGLVQVADIIGMATMFVSTHPYAVSNGLIASLGAAVSGDLIDLTPSLFIGLSMMIVGGVLLVYEVADD